ncbi:SulP family inorganic anion transporter [Limnohabitans sp. Bal53]|uniref:SulP family inorganic anion transporter n=1 Tax=Limnohabitans sp. Bal53 TaxID=1977910 RepID=UPI000D360BCE|nr:sulfate permease [Limnohabitans sp. Bal53]PUE39738.1 sodium-independent anion transporter [Limnohabitans sp. Bal53]
MADLSTPTAWQRWFPILDWGRRYNRSLLTADGVAAAVVTLMLIPQSLAYALLAGLPAQAGLYASMAPLVLYALMGSSGTLAVGPAAVTSLMTAASVGAVAAQGSVAYTEAALMLALLSGAIMLVMGAARLGFLANFLSHPVISGFVSASGLLIAASQLKHLLGVPLHGENLLQLLPQLWQNLSSLHVPTSVMGVGALALLLLVRRQLKPGLKRLGVSAGAADLAAKAAPVVVLLLSIALSAVWQLAEQGVRVVGTVPQGLPPLTLPGGSTGGWAATWALAQALWVPALLISLVGFVESVSVGQSLAAKRRERIDPDAELRALGLSNLGAGLSGGFPVTGGFSRSVVNFDAGARTPAAGIYTAVGLALAALFLTPWLFHLPQATLAATIMVAVVTLVDVGVFARTWHYAKADFIALLLTFGLTLAVGVEAGLIAGVSASVLLLLYRTSRPHIAVVGQVPGTEHYRNVLRHAVLEQPGILGLRVDESLYFANARFLEDTIAVQVAIRSGVRHVVLQCSAINDIDASALESLETINERLQTSGVQLHLSEVKGPVLDRLQRSHFLAQLSGQVFLTHHQAVTHIVHPLSPHN